MIDTPALPLLLVVLTGWLEGQQREALRYLIEENPLPGSVRCRERLGGVLKFYYRAAA